MLNEFGTGQRQPGYLAHAVGTDVRSAVRPGKRAPPRVPQCGKGNFFCLDLAAGKDDNGAERDRALSSDVGYYVKADRDVVRVWCWDQSAPEVFRLNSGQIERTKA